MNHMIEIPKIPKRSAGQVSPKQIAHVVLRTPRIKEMVDWYVKVLDGGVAFENEMLAFVTYDDEHHRIAFANMPHLGNIDPARAGVDHIAFTYAGLGDLVANYDRLKKLGITPLWCVNHGPTISMYYRDPDGTKLELQVDNFPTLEALDAWFKTGDFIANPIGVEIDPDELSAKFHSGVPVTELQKPIFKPLTEEQMLAHIAKLAD